jgi:radical SAM protein with 4Fe4S-binding SPASM domain
MQVSLSDSYHFLSKLTIPKIWNVCKVFLSYQLSKLTRRPIQWGYPITISIEPTTSCNLRCPECPSGLRSFTRAKGKLSNNFFRDITGQLKKRSIYLILYFQGEPFLNPDLIDMISYSKKMGFYTITSTNGHFLDKELAKSTVESGLDRLIISIDGTTQEAYQTYRINGKLEKVLDGAKNICFWKKKLKRSNPHVIFQFLVVKPNEHQIRDVYKIARSIGIDEVKLKSAQLMNYENGHPLMPSHLKYSRYRRTAKGTYVLKNPIGNHCWRLWHTAVVTWDGWVLPCCFDKDAAHKMGNLKSNRFEEIWKNNSYKEFRSEILTDRPALDICTNCTEGCKVWV